MWDLRSLARDCTGRWILNHWTTREVSVLVIILSQPTPSEGFPGGTIVKNPLANSRCKRSGFDPWIGKIPWRRKWQPTPGFLPGESHGQRSLAGYSPWGPKESDTTEWLSTHTRTLSPRKWTFQKAWNISFWVCLPLCWPRITSHTAWYPAGARLVHKCKPLQDIWRNTLFSQSEEQFPLPPWSPRSPETRNWASDAGDIWAQNLFSAPQTIQRRETQRAFHVPWKLISFFIVVVGMLSGEGDGTPLQYSCLENPMDRGAW